MGPLGADIEAVKKQIDQLKLFKSEVDPHMVKVEALNRLVIFSRVKIVFLISIQMLISTSKYPRDLLFLIIFFFHLGVEFFT